MEKETSQKIKLGFFVITGLVLMIMALYLIGRNKNIFGKNFEIIALFKNVNGLQTGNNVRFAGTDVGSIASVTIINDSSVKVVLVVDEKYQPFIKKNAFAAVGTDGLMGNKLVNILNPVNVESMVISNHDTIEAVTPVETDEMLRTLNRTNEYVSTIAFNLKNLTEQIGSSRGTIWKLLTDKALSNQLDSMMTNLHKTTKQIYTLSSSLNSIVGKIQKGDGMMGSILNDTVFYANLQRTMIDLKTTTERTSRASEDLEQMMAEIEHGKGTIGTLIKDTSLSVDLKQSVINIKEGAYNFNQTMEALKQSALLKGYFKKMEKDNAEKKKKSKN